MNDEVFTVSGMPTLVPRSGHGLRGQSSPWYGSLQRAMSRLPGYLHPLQAGGQLLVMCEPWPTIPNSLEATVGKVSSGTTGEVWGQVTGEERGTRSKTL